MMRQDMRASLDGDDRFTVHARELLTAKLMNHPDEGVRTITAMFGVPDDAVEQVAARLRAEAKPDAQEEHP